MRYKLKEAALILGSAALVLGLILGDIYLWRLVA